MSTCDKYEALAVKQRIEGAYVKSMTWLMFDAYNNRLKE